MPTPPSTTPQTQVVNQTSRGRPTDDVGDEERHRTEQPQHRADADHRVHVGEARRQRRGGSGTALRLTRVGAIADGVRRACT